MLLSFCSSAEALDEYYSSINKMCPNTNILLIKKSLLEISSEKPCTSLFTSVLLKECPSLNCKFLADKWASYTAKNSGAVVGK